VVCGLAAELVIAGVDDIVRQRFGLQSLVGDAFPALSAVGPLMQGVRALLGPPADSVDVAG
jgi:ethanolamine transporter EutH